MQQQQTIQLAFSESTLPEILRTLYQQGIGTLLVEGGAKTLQVFLNAGLYDEVLILESDHCLDSGFHNQFGTKPQTPIEKLDRILGSIIFRRGAAVQLQAIPTK